MTGLESMKPPVRHGSKPHDGATSVTSTCCLLVPAYCCRDLRMSLEWVHGMLLVAFKRTIP